MVELVRVLFLGPASASHVTRWVAHLRSRGHEVLLASMHAIPPEFTEGSVALAPRLTEGPTGTGTLLRSVGAARRAARDFHPDVVCAYYMASYGLLAALARLRPWVGAAAGGDVLVDAYDGLGTRVRNGPVLRFVLRTCSGMLAWAPHVGDRLAELGVPGERILVQPRGVNRDLFRYRPPRERGDTDPLRIFSVRWLKPLYRVDTLVRALAQLREAGVPFEARVGGEGPERPRLEAMVRESGLERRVTFIGRLEADDVPGAMRWADVYVSTSSSDGASSSLFEALSVGAYPVVTDIVANHPLVEAGRTGDLFPVGDAEALAEALTLLARDDTRRRQGIEAARDFVAERLDYDRNMSRIEVFLGAIARGAREPLEVAREGGA